MYTYISDYSQEDLAFFHAAHFSSTSVSHFSEHFLGPVEETRPEETEDDGLGYYEDGIKRTLTDNQIAIFRHSEIQTLLRERRHAEEAMTDDGNGQISKPVVEKEGEVEDGELRDDVVVTETVTPSGAKNGHQSTKKERKAHQAKQRGFFKQNIKPDLRKRTWDKVDTGVGSLDYDEESSAARVPGPASQRRRISYDDD
jgi:hypothetical protein